MKKLHRHKIYLFNKIYLLIALSFIISLLSACSTDLVGKGNVAEEQQFVLNGQPKNTYRIPPPGYNVIGYNAKITAQPEATLSKISDHYDVGIDELRYANPSLEPKSIRIGQEIIIPMKYILPPKKYRRGIVINVPELRLYYFTNNDDVMTFPVGLGRAGWRTPLRTTYVYRKKEQPTWHVPKSIRDYGLANGKELPITIGPGPNNPLGDYAIYLHLNGYLIHGTNSPTSIGRLVSSGCIRMFNKDVSRVYQSVGQGTPVHIIYYPNKVAWDGDKLYLESHAPIVHEKGVYANAEIPINKLIDRAIAVHPAHINWAIVAKTLKQHTGIPTVIGYASDQRSKYPEPVLGFSYYRHQAAA